MQLWLKYVSVQNHWRKVAWNKQPLRVRGAPRIIWKLISIGRKWWKNWQNSNLLHYLLLTITYHQLKFPEIYTFHFYFRLSFSRVVSQEIIACALWGILCEPRSWPSCPKLHIQIGFGIFRWLKNRFISIVLFKSEINIWELIFFCFILIMCRIICLWWIGFYKK